MEADAAAPPVFDLAAALADGEGAALVQAILDRQRHRPDPTP